MFQNDIENVNDGYKLITFTDKFGKFVAVSPVNCVIECEDCEEWVTMLVKTRMNGVEIVLKAL